MTALANVVDIIGDNPVLDKDASLLLKKKRAAALWVVMALGLLGVASMAYLEGVSRDLRVWGGLNPAGGEMLLILTGIILGALSIFVPALASTAIAAERERGTLPLLLISGLTPARIVAGKVLAVWTATLPFLAISFPLFALSSVFLGVDIDAVLLAVVGVVLHSFTAAAAGVWASAVCGRMRSAALVALLASGVTTLLGVFPIMGSLISTIEDQQEHLLLVGAIGLVVEVVLAAALCIGAWSVLAPRSAERGKPGRLLLLATSFGIPALCALFLALFGGHDQDVHALMLLESMAVVALTMLVAPAISGRQQGTPTPLKAGLMASFAGLFGLALVWATFPDNMRDDLDAEDLASLITVGAAICGVAVFTARWWKNPVGVVAVTAGVFAALWIIPAILDELTYGRPPLAFLNPAYVLDRSDVSVIPLLMFYGVVALATLIGGRGERRV